MRHFVTIRSAEQTSDCRELLPPRLEALNGSLISFANRANLVASLPADISLNKEKLELKDVFYKFGYLTFNGTWLSPHELAYRANGFFISDLRSNQSDVMIIDGESLVKYHFSNILVSLKVSADIIGCSLLADSTRGHGMLHIS